MRSWTDSPWYIRQLMPIVRNNLKYVEYSMTVPPPVVNYLKCLTPMHLRVIAQAIDSNALQALNAGDMEMAIKLLGCNVTSEEDLVSEVTKKLVLQKNKLEKIIEEKKTKISNYESEIMVYDTKIQAPASEIEESADIMLATVENYKENKKKLKSRITSAKESIVNFTGQLSDINSKIQGITDRITDIDNKTCPICQMTPEGVSITPVVTMYFALNVLLQ